LILAFKVTLTEIYLTQDTMELSSLMGKQELEKPTQFKVQTPMKARE